MGLHLSAPITTMHIERHKSPIMNAACVHVHGWRLTQEDAHNIIEDINGNGIMLFGVYDGHGGSLAAQYLQEVIPSAFKSITSLNDHTAITNLMLEIDAEFITKQHQDGTTCCIVLAQLWDVIQNAPIAVPFNDYFKSIDYNVDFLKNNTVIRLLSINIGDSRAMVVTSNAIYSPTQNTPSTSTAVQSTQSNIAYDPIAPAISSSATKKRANYLAITNDHKPQNEAERQRIVNALGTVTGNRVDGSLALSRAIGDAPYKENTLLPQTQQKVIAVPDFQTHTIYWGDVLLVCCDGIFESDRMTYNEVAKVTTKSIQSIINTQKLIVPSDDNGTTNSINPNKTNNDKMINNDDNNTDKNSNLLNSTLQIGIDSMMSDSSDDMNAPEYADWDPGLVARDLIETSLLAESKDNHTAIVISFKLPKLNPTALKQINNNTTSPSTTPSTNSQNNDGDNDDISNDNILVPTLLDYLPVKECIPGPYAAHSKDSDWAQTYLKDLQHQGYKFEDIKEVVDILDGVISAHCNDAYEPITTTEVGVKIIDAMNQRLVKLNQEEEGNGEKKDETTKNNETKKNDQKKELFNHNVSIVAPILVKKQLLKVQKEIPQNASLDTVFHQILRAAQASSKANMNTASKNPKEF